MPATLPRSVWHELILLRDAIAARPLAALFAEDPDRFQRRSRQADGLLLDLSKQRLTKEIVSGLCLFAEASGFAEARERLFAAAHVNRSEDRPALHWALRRSGNAPVVANGVDVMPAIRSAQDR